MSFISQPFESLKTLTMNILKKRVYDFCEGSSSDLALLGHKGVSLCEMSRLGISVPHGFIISTDASIEFLDNNQTIVDGLIHEYTRAIHELERSTGLTFGTDRECPPLLLAVRSGSSIMPHEIGMFSANPRGLLSVPESWSVPGASKTFLNVGLNEKMMNNMSKKYGVRFALDSYIRHIMSFGILALGVNPEEYSSIIEECKENRGGSLTISDMQYIVQKFKAIKEIPEDPWVQLYIAIRCIYTNWFSESAIKYRQLAMDLPSKLGVAICIQTMVFGNSSFRSGTGICFSRNPITGVKELFGDFVFNSEGEDVILRNEDAISLKQLSEQEPRITNELSKICTILEKFYTDIQDIEFAADGGYISILQTRRAQRSSRANVKVAVDMVHEGLLTVREALLRIDADKIDSFTYTELDPSSLLQEYSIAKGFPSCQGVITGRLVFTLSECEEWTSRGNTVILCLKELNINDIDAVKLASGVLTIEGSSTSDSAVLCRGLGKVGITGASSLQMFVIDGKRALLCSDCTAVKVGDEITLDGSSGCVYRGSIPTIEVPVDDDYDKIIGWADSHNAMHISVNTTNFVEISLAADSRLEGIGCMCTEFLFLNDLERLDLMRMILFAKNTEEREAHVKTMYVV
eukprot:gene3299-6533_t